MLFWLLPGRGALGLVVAIVGALLLGVLAALIVFGRRAQKAAYGQMEGQPGAAAAALRHAQAAAGRSTRRSRSTKQQDVVHRVVGPPGIVLVGEGNPTGCASCWPASAASTSGSPPRPRSTRSSCGNGEGQVPLPKLSKHVSKLKPQVKPAEMTDVLARLKALGRQPVRTCRCPRARCRPA